MRRARCRTCHDDERYASPVREPFWETIDELVDSAESIIGSADGPPITQARVSRVRLFARLAIHQAPEASVGADVVDHLRAVIASVGLALAAFPATDRRAWRAVGHHIEALRRIRDATA